MLFSFIDSHTKKEEENPGFLGGRITLSLSQDLPSKLRGLSAPAQERKHNHQKQE
jgi:hypothetical protein